MLLNNKYSVKVSIVTYVYVDNTNHRLELLRENLESVANQKFKSYEHVIIDDGSKIDIQPLVELFPNTVYIRKDQTGITASSHTFNLALTSAKGEYIAILSSDDLHLEHSIENLVKALDDNHDWIAATGAAIYSTDNVKKRVFLPSYEATLDNFSTYGCFINGCSIMWRMDCFKEMGLPPHFASSAADFDMWVRLAQYGRIGYISNVVVDYRDHSDSTRKKTEMPRQLKPKEYEIDYYNYHKCIRVVFVLSSAVKRSVSTRSFNRPAKQYANSIDIDGVKHKLPYSEFNKLLPFLKTARNISFKSNFFKNTLSNDFKEVINLIDGVGEVHYTSLNPISVLISHFLKPETRQSLKLQADFKTSFYTEFFNWGFLDKLEATKEDISYLGLDGMVNNQVSLGIGNGLKHKRLSIN